MKIPNSGRRKALILVDIQPAFLKSHNRSVLAKIQNLLKQVTYDLYIECVFFAEKGSIWDVQTNWICPRGKRTATVKEIKSFLPKNTIRIEKMAKSAFKGNVPLQSVLNKKGIKEVHIVGLDTNDCVLATAYESFDLGFFTYVIEDCCASSGPAALHKHAVALLRHLSLTNNAVHENIPMKHI